MKKEYTPDFIVIDDDPINNMICSEFINLTISGTEIRTFTDPEKGLQYLTAKYAEYTEQQTVLFLDINMPFLSGWDVLERLEGFPDCVKKHLTVFMLSSSLDVKDKEKANAHPLVSGYISKFLSPEKLKEIFPVKSV